MYKPYSKPVVVASPDIKVQKSRISKLVVFACRLLGRLYLFLVLGIARMVLRNGRPLFDAYKRALEGKSRCIIAFRHPNGGEAQLLLWFFLFKLRSLARKEKVQFPGRPYVSFVYGYEILRWGGAVARWIMPGLLSMPVHHAKMDSAGMNRILRTISEGPYPLAIAPEGQVSYITELVQRLEKGTIRIGFQVAERLEKEGNSSPVEILPVSTHFRYGKMGQWSLNKLIRKIEKYTGFSGKRDGAGFTERLRRARDFILRQNEKRYNITPVENQSFSHRVDAVMGAALDKAEKLLDIHPRGKGIVERLYHIKQICWDRMIIPGLNNLNSLSLLERALADLRSGEAWHASRHMELVDFVWYFRVPLPVETDPLHKKIEYVQNLWDFANRTMGGAYSNRVLNVHPKRVLIQIAPVINLSKRLKDYKKNKKDAIAKAMKDMEMAFLDCIDRAAEYQI